MEGLDSFTRLSAQLDGGALAVAPEEARHCARICEGILAELHGIQRQIDTAPRPTGFGMLHTGMVMTEKYENKLRGPENSLRVVIEAHITILADMRRAFLDAAQRYEDTELENLAHFTPAGG